ncbi:MAG: OadG family protein [Clostridia bacterium]|nr:OadG family protein [Clostridia bacterium]
MEILEQFTHADSFALMPMGDKLIATIYVIMLGMGITFTALVLIWGLTVLMSKIIMAMDSNMKPEIKTVEPVVAQKPVVEEPKEEDQSELIAVITAAIAASLNTSMHNIVVSNITRVSDNTPVWGQTGRSEVMASRF